MSVGRRCDSEQEETPFFFFLLYVECGAREEGEESERTRRDREGQEKEEEGRVDTLVDLAGK